MAYINTCPQADCVGDAITTPSPSNAGEEGTVDLHPSQQDREGLDDLEQLEGDLEGILGDCGQQAVAPHVLGARSPRPAEAGQATLQHPARVPDREAIRRTLVQELVASGALAPGGYEIAEKLLAGENLKAVRKSAEAMQIQPTAAKRSALPEQVEASFDLYFSKTDDATFPRFARIGSSDVVKEVGRGLVLPASKNYKLEKGVPEWVTTGVTIYFPAHIALEVTAAVGINPNIKGEFASYTAPRRGGVEIGLKVTYQGKDPSYTLKKGKELVAMVMVASRPSFTIHHREKIPLPEGADEEGWPIRLFQDAFDENRLPYTGKKLRDMGRVEREEAEDRLRKELFPKDLFSKGKTKTEKEVKTQKKEASPDKEGEGKKGSIAGSAQTAPPEERWAREVAATEATPAGGDPIDLRQVLEEHRKETERLRKSIELRDALLQDQMLREATWPLLRPLPRQTSTMYYSPGYARGEPAEAKRPREQDDFVKIGPYQPFDEYWERATRAGPPATYSNSRERSSSRGRRGRNGGPAKNGSE